MNIENMIYKAVLVFAVAASAVTPAWASYVIPNGSITSPKLSQTTGVAIHGTTTNDDAATGFVGEYLEQKQARAAAVTCSTSAVDLASVSLTAGDWDVSLLGLIQPTTSFVNISWSISTAATTVGNAGDNRIDVMTVNNSTGDQGWALPVYRIKAAGTVTAYLDCKATSAVSAYGKIYARRVR